MDFEQILAQYWPQLSEEGLGTIADSYVSTAQLMMDDVRNLQTNVDEAIRDDLANNGIYREYKRKLDFEYRTLFLTYLSSLAINMDQLQGELPAKMTEGYHVYILMTAVMDFIDALKTTGSYRDSEAGRIFIDSVKSYVEQVNKQYVDYAKGMSEENIESGE